MAYTRTPVDQHQTELDISLAWMVLKWHKQSTKITLKIITDYFKNINDDSFTQKLPGVKLMMVSNIPWNISVSVKLPKWIYVFQRRASY